MADFTENEVAKLKALAAQEAELGNLADNEAAIISRMATPMVGMGALPAAGAIDPTDLLLIQQDGVAKSAEAGMLVEGAPAAFDPEEAYPAGSVGAKLSDIVSVKDQGATGDGVTDDTAAITASELALGRKFTPYGTYLTTLASTALRGPFYGDGQIKDTSANKRAPNFSAIVAAPSSLGNEGSIETAFNGDLRKVQFAVEHRITGTATLGQPTTGYTYRPECYPHYTYLYNSSGWNQSTSGNGGRTGAAAYRVKIDQYGQGDLVAFNFTAFVTGTKAGATHFLANPAGVGFNGDMHCGANYVYLNPRELALYDDGYDVACIGDVVNLNRTNATGGQSCWWSGYRVQSIGSAAIDSVVSATGKINVGIDYAMSTTDFGTNQAAISLKAGQRIYGNNASSNGNFTTTFNGDYITYSPGVTGWIIVAGGNPNLQITSGQVTVPSTARLKADGPVTLAGLASSNYANDAAAAAGGIPVGGIYRNGSVLMVRVA